MNVDWSGVFKALLDFLSLKDTGVGPPGIAIILGLLLILWLYRKLHLDVVKFFKDELTRVAQERDKWENRYFDDKLKSSDSEFYTKTPEGESQKPSPEKNGEADNKR